MDAGLVTNASHEVSDEEAPHEKVPKEEAPYEKMSNDEAPGVN